VGLEVILSLAQGRLDFILTPYWRILIPLPDNYCAVPKPALPRAQFMALLYEACIELFIGQKLSTA